MKGALGWFERHVLGSGFLELLPQYAHALSRFDPLDDPDVGVMAVSPHGRRIRLHANVQFFDSHPEYFMGVLQHEVHHVILGHVSQRGSRDVEHPALMQQAEEVSANEYIRAPLPGHPARWEDFEHLGLRAGQSTKERYRLLVKAQESGALRQDEIHVCCAGGAGASAGELAGLRRRMRAGCAGQGKPGSRPGKELERVPPLAGDSAEQIDWRAALASAARPRRARKLVYWRPNRRFPERIGEVPGRAHAASRTKLLVGIDTSKSMPAPVFALIARELVKLARWCDATIVECDAAIQRTYPFSGTLAVVQGRGGTDLRPVFEPKLLREHAPDAIVYFTDGEGPYPAVAPALPVLWVLTRQVPFDCAWGRQIRMEEGALGG